MRRFKILVFTAGILYTGLIFAQVKQKTITITIEKDKNGKVIKSDTQTIVSIVSDSLMLAPFYFPRGESFVFTHDFDSVRGKILVVTDSIISSVMHSFNGDKGNTCIFKHDYLKQGIDTKAIDSVLKVLNLKLNKGDGFFKEMEDCIFLGSDMEWTKFDKDFFSMTSDSNLHYIFHDWYGVDTCKNKKPVKIIVRQKPKLVDLDKSDKDALRKNGLKIDEESPKEVVTSLKFFPNPSSGKIELQFSALEELPTQVMIYDLKGKEVYKKDMGSFVGKFSEILEIKDSLKGIYVLVIQRGKYQVSKKIIME